VPSDGRGIRAIASRLLNGQVPPDAELAELPVAGDVPASGAATGSLVAEPALAPGREADPGSEAPETPAAVALGLPPDAPGWLVTAAEVELEAAARSAARTSAPPPMWRRVGFAAAVVVLI